MSLKGYFTLVEDQVYRRCKDPEEAVVDLFGTAGYVFAEIFITVLSSIDIERMDMSSLNGNSVVQAIMENTDGVLYFVFYH
jgi:hypothetical protein